VYQDIKKATSSKKAYHGHKLMFSSKAQLPILFNYFEQFHLQSRKYGQVLKVKQCYELMVQKGFNQGRISTRFGFAKDLREIKLQEKKYNK
jgi:hypothetical protein